jgi:hypothetical protein
MTTDVRRLARSISVDVSTDGTTWLNLPGRVDNSPQITPNKVDSTDVDTGGFTSSEITLQSGVLTVKYNALSNGGTPNPAQELVRACVAQFGDSARLYVRWYDNDGGSDAWSARAIVEVQRSKTGVADLMEIQATFTLDGAITAISNPYSAALAPVLISATPSAVAVGGIVKITGQHFTGTVATTGVKFGGVNATSWIVVSDSTIVAVMPAGSAGSAVVLVTNATGASNSLSYTRGA